MAGADEPDHFEGDPEGLLAFLRSRMEGGQLRVWRSVMVGPEGIRPDLGLHWSWSPDGATTELREHAEGYGEDWDSPAAPSLAQVSLEALVPEGAVDWDSTVRRNTRLHPEEREVTLLPGAEVTLVHARDWDGNDILEPGPGHRV